MDNNRNIEDLSEVEYENLVKDYETTKISINDLIAKYKLDPSCKKFGFYNAFTRYIKTKLGCPNCGARLYREVFPRKTDRRVVYKCFECTHSDVPYCQCDFCRDVRAKELERHRELLEQEQAEEEKRKQEELLKQAYYRAHLIDYLKDQTNQSEFFSFYNLSLEDQIAISSICSKATLICNTGVLVSFELQPGIKENFFPQTEKFELWLEQAFKNRLISVDPHSKIDAFIFNDGSLKIDLNKVNFKIMIKELYDSENYDENLKKIRTMCFSYPETDSFVNNVKELWHEIGYQEIVYYINYRLKLINPKFEEYIPTLKIERCIRSLFKSGVSIGKIQALIHGAVSSTTSYLPNINENLPHIKNHLIFMIEKKAKELLNDHNRFKNAPRDYRICQSDISYIFFNVFLGMDSEKNPNIINETPCSDDVIRDLLKNKTTRNEDSMDEIQFV